MKRRRSWFLDLLALGVPTMLSMSGRLPGTSGGKNTERSDRSSAKLLKAINKALSKAERALSAGRLKKVETALREADSLSERIDPDTSGFKKMNSKKTNLWEQYAQMRAAKHR